MIRIAFSFIAVCLCLFAPLRALADTINLFGDSVVYDLSFGGTGFVHFVGDRGFTFDGTTSIVSGKLVPAEQCITPTDDCKPGMTLSLLASASGGDLRGHATLDGVSYPIVGTAGIGANAGYLFTGTVTLPPFGQSPTVSLTVPVEFLLGFFNVDGVGPNQLIASGSATLMLQEGTTSQGIPAWQWRGIRYDLAPVPEPTTLALVGTALAVVGTVAVVQRRNKYNGTRDTISRK